MHFNFMILLINFAELAINVAALMLTIWMFAQNKNNRPRL
jgi:hypothetical protein